MMNNPQNDLDHRKGKSKVESYLTLIGMSILSALAILSPWAIVFSFGNAGVCFIIFIPPLQFALVFLFSSKVSNFYAKLVSQNNFFAIQPKIQTSIPLIFNLLAAFGWIILILGANFLSFIKNYSPDHDAVLTVKNGAIIPPVEIAGQNDARYKYRAKLHIKNDSGATMQPIDFLLGAYENNDLFSPYDAWDRALGNTSWQPDPFEDSLYPTGSEIKIEIALKDTLKCGNKNFDKPLYLLYFIGERYTWQAYKSIRLSDSVNQELKKIACK